MKVLPPLLSFLVLAFHFCLPDPLFDPPLSPVLYDRKGIMLGARVASDGQWRFAPADRVNRKFAAALTAYEDRRFYLHRGVDLLAAVRAAVQNARSLRVVSGASTITMQTVRLMRGKTKRTFREKTLEAILALRLEFGRTKEEILALYAANAPFGGNVVGLEAAAWRWFGRGSADLSWAEAATLAVLPNSPALVRPGKNGDVLRKKRDRLLGKLRGKGLFDDETLKLALAESLPGVPKKLPNRAPQLMDRMLSEGRGGAIRTTVDEGLQVHATAVVEKFSQRFRQSGILNAACLILDNNSAEPLAYVGNTEGGGDLDLIRRRRSSGSTLKPFLYAAMLDAGELMSGELVKDIPVRVNGYRPENNLNTYLGVVPADEALNRSLNVPAVQMLSRFGVARFADFLRSLGLTTLWRKGEDYGLPLILGGAEVTLWEISARYRDLATGGGGKITPAAAYRTLEALKSDRNIAYKTGTSFGLRDAWCIGVTQKYTVGVWVGNAAGEGRPELRGGSTAAPLMLEVFGFLPESPWFKRPDDLVTVAACSNSGFPPGPDCPGVTDAEIPAGAPRRDTCPYCRTINGEKWFVLPPAEEWYYRRWNLDYRVPPAKLPSGGSAASPIALFNPEEGAGVYVPTELDGSPGSLVLQAAHRDNDARLFWHLDGVFLTATAHFHEIEVRPAPGEHTVLLIDQNGALVRRTFSVIH